jgi:hypothetical protein
MTSLKDLVLPGFSLPSLLLPAGDERRAHALYGSCRKMHGPKPDMMRAAELVLKQQPDGRPEVLFLGGDQIYADDVDSTLIKLISALALEVMGSQESIPGLTALAQSPTSNRGRSLKAFTSGEMEHHLLTFGEYAATYLLAWNPDVWEIAARQVDAPVPKEPALSARSARRVLANCVTYMIFDDHEITDDWFLHPEWREKADDNVTTKRVIANGMAAYWAFQGWGNLPDGFSDDFIKAMSDFTYLNHGAEDARARLLSFNGWSYMAPTGTPALVLNTRTNRSTSKGIKDFTEFLGPPRSATPILAEMKRDVAPRLLGPSQRARSADLIKQELIGRSPLIVVAPTPVFGFRPIEELGRVLAKRVSPTFADYENWAANCRNIADFVDLVFTKLPEFVVVLSGDVHYGFEIAVSISTASTTLPVAQFCASALKNHPTGVLGFGAQVLRSGLLLEHPVAWWDFPSKGGSDGPIVRAFSGGLKLPKLVKEFGHPTFTIKEQINVRDGERIVLTNNLGELIIDRSSVKHRFWRPSNDSFAPDAFLEWNPASWPAPRVWHEVTPALSGLPG